MDQRLKAVSATSLIVIGGTLLAISLVGGSDLEAAGIVATGFNLAKFLLWGGIGLLIVSAFLFISASAE